MTQPLQTANMQLNKPQIGEPGSQWTGELNANTDKLDAHDHSGGGKGLPATPKAHASTHAAGGSDPITGLAIPRWRLMIGA